MTMPNEQKMQQAVANRDAAFDGLFYYAVITTSIFCKPSCSTKAANTKNLRYYETIGEAKQAGFRPCKRCKPTQIFPQSDRLTTVAKYIEDHFDEQLTLLRLSGIANLSPSRLQRVFNDAFGVSPKVYQDAIRMQKFKQSLRHGEGVTDAIFSSGFGSISRIYGEASRNIGMTPKAYRVGGEGENITYACRVTALGIMVMAATETGVCFVQFGDSELELVSKLKEEFPKAVFTPSPAQSSLELNAWIDALNKHISEDSPRPDLPLDMRGTVFQIKVWKFLLNIKEGHALSYSELAAHIDKPKAVRAVASACAKNRIGILIPCHRVLRGDGSLGGYRWGLDRKRILLDKERQK